MARLYVFAEGQTEQTFADVVLKPHLAGFGVYMHPTVLVAHARKKKQVLRGGGRNYVPMKNDILRFLKQEKATDVFFTTMIDLYAIHVGFPRLEDAEKLRHLPAKRVEFLEKAFGEDIGDRRFLPYLQLHEYEAYLFSDPQWFGYFFPDHAGQIAELRDIAASQDTPELINDGPATAPSKRIAAILPQYAAAKAVMGPQIAELIGLFSIRTQCPHFGAWLEKLERLGGEP